ncbi:hypothetical protein BJ165DRAFT_1532596 [Panaeolus papilionaceus]|nr:hypothetical protein BJ165DRAFT_1532596 [Panaeolus papilionaceus]
MANSLPATNIPLPAGTTPAAPNVTTTPTPTAFTQIRAMPVPRSSSAPHFDGKYVNDFLDTLEHHARVAAVPESELPKLIAKYCNDEVKAVIRYNPVLSGSDWNATRDLFIELYGAEDLLPKANLEQLRSFIRESAGLLHESVIDDTEMKFKFLLGIPKRTRYFVVSKLPSANKQIANPPNIKDIISIINQRFDPSHIESYSVGFENDELEDELMSAAPVPAKPVITTIPSSQSHVKREQTKSSTPSSDIDALAQQLQQLSLNQAQMQQMMQSALSIVSSQNRPARTNNNRTCFICGQTDTHRLHPRHCPETAELINESLIRYDTRRDRYRLELQAALLSTSEAYALTKHAETLHHTSQPPNYDEHYYEREEGGLSHYSSHPVTRSGKDSSARFDPSKRPPPRKTSQPSFPPSATQPSANQKPNATHAPPSAPAPAKKATDNPQPPAINTRDGYKESFARPKAKDVEMRDPTEGNKKPQYRYTSDVQEQVSADALLDYILKTQLSVSLRDLIGLSPTLQKKIADTTKTRREYVTNSGEYDLYSPEAADFLSRETEPVPIQPASQLMVGDPSVLDSFLLRYSNAVHFKPTRKFAMTTGSFVGSLGGQNAKFLVDCGSELNIFPERLLNATGLALDYDGAKWSLKGVNGEAEGLRGVCRDVPIEVGGHRFDHHFFVTCGDMEHQDCILGQPWLQWFAARVDHQRDGVMSIALWKNGDRRERPTISIQLTRPDDPRNVDSVNPKRPSTSNSASPNPYAHHAQVEEILDDDYYPNQPHF